MSPTAQPHRHSSRQLRRQGSGSGASIHTGGGSAEPVIEAPPVNAAPSWSAPDWSVAVKNTFIQVGGGGSTATATRQMKRWRSMGAAAEDGDLPNPEELGVASGEKPFRASLPVPPLPSLLAGVGRIPAASSAAASAPSSDAGASTSSGRGSVQRGAASSGSTATTAASSSKDAELCMEIIIKNTFVEAIHCGASPEEAGATAPPRRLMRSMTEPLSPPRSPEAGAGAGAAASANLTASIAVVRSGAAPLPLTTAPGGGGHALRSAAPGVETQLVAAGEASSEPRAPTPPPRGCPKTPLKSKGGSTVHSSRIGQQEPSSRNAPSPKKLRAPAEGCSTSEPFETPIKPRSLAEEMACTMSTNGAGSDSDSSSDSDSDSDDFLHNYRLYEQLLALSSTRRQGARNDAGQVLRGRP